MYRTARCRSRRPICLQRLARFDAFRQRSESMTCVNSAEDSESTDLKSPSRSVEKGGHRASADPRESDRGGDHGIALIDLLLDGARKPLKGIKSNAKYKKRPAQCRPLFMPQDNTSVLGRSWRWWKGRGRLQRRLRGRRWRQVIATWIRSCHRAWCTGIARRHRRINDTGSCGRC